MWGSAYGRAIPSPPPPPYHNFLSLKRCYEAKPLLMSIDDTKRFVTPLSIAALENGFVVSLIIIRPCDQEGRTSGRLFICYYREDFIDACYRICHDQKIYDQACYYTVYANDSNFYYF